MTHLIRGFAAAATIAIIAMSGWTSSPRAESVTGPGSWMGIKVVTLNGAWRGAGVRVTEVEAAGPADRIGIVPGDVLVSVGSTTLKHEDDLTTARTHLTPSQPIPVVIARGNGSMLTIKNLEPIAASAAEPSAASASDTSTDVAAAAAGTAVTAAAGADAAAAALPTTTEPSPGAVAAAAVAVTVPTAIATPASDSAVAAQDPLASCGMQCANLNHDLASALGVAADAGVLVLQVTPDGSAERVGMRAGDVISAANAVGLGSVDALASALRATPSGTVLHIVRRDDERDITLSLFAPPVPPAETPAAARAQQEAMEKELQGLRHEIEELRHQVAAGKSGH